MSVVEDPGLPGVGALVADGLGAAAGAAATPAVLAVRRLGAWRGSPVGRPA